MLSITESKNSPTVEPLIKLVLACAVAKASRNIVKNKLAIGYGIKS